MRAKNIPSLIAVAAVWFAYSQAVAGEYSFTTPTSLPRHGGQELPDLVPLPTIVTAPTTFSYRHPATAAWEPAMQAVDAAPGAVAVSAQTGPGSAVASAVRASAARDDAMVMGAARIERLSSYEDAAGARVGTGFLRDSEYVVGGAAAPGGTRLGVSAFHDSFTDAHAPNYSLDVPLLNRVGAGVSATSVPLNGVFDALDWQGGWWAADLEANNYTLRPPISAQVAVESAWRTWHSAARLRSGDAMWVTMEVSHETADANRYSREYGPAVVSAIRLPDAHAQRLALEVGHKWAKADARIEGALRTDLGQADAGRADDRPNVPGGDGTVFNLTPRELYRRYYGSGDTAHHEAELGGRLRGEYDLAAGRTVFLDARRAVRLPEMTELYYGNSGSGELLQVGNPGLAPEKHHRVETGVVAQSAAFGGYGRAGTPGTVRLTTGAFANRIQDFITVDRARGQAGVTAADNAIVYRNVEAVISGVSGDLQANLAPHLSTRLTVTGQRGRNLSDDRPLYQVPPLEANLFVDAFGTETGWNVGARLRMVATKRSVDDSTQTGSGQDVSGPTAGFTTADVYGGYLVNAGLAVSVGVENVFDKLYREHVVAAPQTVTSTGLNAPGRTVFVRGMMAF